MRKAKQAKAEPAPPLHNIFWDKILIVRREEPKRFNLFSPGFRWSAEIYEEQLAIAEQGGSK